MGKKWEMEMIIMLRGMYYIFESIIGRNLKLFLRNFKEIDAVAVGTSSTTF